MKSAMNPVTCHLWSLKIELFALNMLIVLWKSMCFSFKTFKEMVFVFNAGGIPSCGAIYDDKSF